MLGTLIEASIYFQDKDFIVKRNFPHRLTPCFMHTKLKQMFAGQNCFKSYENIFGAKFIVILLHNQCIIRLILKNMDLATLASEINCIFYRSLHQDEKNTGFGIGRACALFSRFLLLLLFLNQILCFWVSVYVSPTQPHLLLLSLSFHVVAIPSSLS